MNNPLRNSFKIQIQSLYLFEFQDFITELFMLRYGTENFIPPREIKDKGADGIITDKNMVIACYGPKKIDKDRYTQKIANDFKLYSDNWQTDYKNWMFVTNNNIPEWGITKINSLKKDSLQIGLDNIVLFVEELPSYQKRELGNYLNINKDLFALDYLKEIIEDLIKDASFTNDNVEYTKQIYFPDKVSLNFDQEDIPFIFQEYDSYFEKGVFNEISNLLFGYDDEDFEKLKHRIIYDFNNKTGNAKGRLYQLTEKYLDKYSNENDDEYLYYIRAILIYLFEQCLIGIKTIGENDITTP
ncbi:MAG: hypothetical protein GQ564_13825 [Bacteroidales bacterium]|nr:hypothetical protein [Bacteroidales bacterium]